MARVRTSKRGAVLIPKSMREAVGLEPGQLVDVSVEGKDRILVTPIRLHPVGALYGILKGDGCGTVEDFLRDRRREGRSGRGM